MRLAAALSAIVVLFAAWWAFAHRRGAPLVVYCAHDSIYSEKILRDFEARTGVKVAIRFDTEATKSLGLVELLVREKDAPRCDLFWNNELLGTMDLAERGVLEAYRGAGWQRMPEKFRDPEGRWTGFAARLRVVIFNPAKISAEQIPAAIEGDLARFAIAKPLYGTTLTHFCALWQTLGADGVRGWRRSALGRGLIEVNGNAAVKDAVASGVCDFGFTDTDDFFEAKDAGKAVACVPVRIAGGKSICIPNTVAIIRGSKRAGDARKLADFLLSAETELALARSRSRQIPLGPMPADQLPVEVPELSAWANDGIDLTQLGPARAACLAWLKAEFVK
jgi:iron(III) transport system substrate-binding protein